MITTYQRQYLQPNTTYYWEQLEGFATDLENRDIQSVKELEDVLYRFNELTIIIIEQASHLRLHLMRYTKDEEIAQQWQVYSKTVKAFELTKGKVIQQLLTSPFLEDLIQKHPSWKFMLQALQSEQKTFCVENIEVNAKNRALIDEYNQLSGQKSVTINGKTQPTVLAFYELKDADRTKRKANYQAIIDCEKKYKDQIDDLFERMIETRHTLATNANYKNYRDYIWDEKAKIHYTPEDVENLCNSVRYAFIPVQRKINAQRKAILDIPDLYEWDQYVELSSAKNTNFFETEEDLIQKTKTILQLIHPEFYRFFSILEEKEMLDLTARKNKTTAMFCMPFPETKYPFIFANLNNSILSIITMFHETAHAIHFLYNRDKTLMDLRMPSTEVSELFSLTMELISMEYWEHFFQNKESLIWAKIYKLKVCLGLFRLSTLWEKFQHWIYVHPHHTREERYLQWQKISDEFNTGIQQTPDLQGIQNHTWQRRGLIFRAPFYMIEYAFAQLGALAIYKNYKENPQKTIEQIIASMKLGNTKSLQELYETAGIRFDFSKEYVTEIAQFLEKEYEALCQELGI